MQPYTATTKTTVIDGESDKKISEDKESPYDTITEITTTDGTTNTSKNSNTTANDTQNQADNSNNTTKNQTNNTANSDSNSNKTTVYDPKWVQATFTVEDVGVTLD